ncbi:MAG: hypothetical protein ACP5N1_00200 [Candidatus Woesearchaeota archaeon]
MPLTEEYLKSVSESQLKDRAYTPYELEKHERDSLEEIRKTLKKSGYKTKDDIQDSLDFLEKLANKINIAVTNEKRDNKTTWELETDLTDIKKIFDKLNQMLQEIESKEVETKLNKRSRK